MPNKQFNFQSATPKVSCISFHSCSYRLWPDLQIGNIIAYFFQIPFYYIFIIYVNTYPNVFAGKVSASYSKIFKVAATERSICTVSIWKINHWRFLKWMQLTNGVNYGLEFCTIMFVMNWRMNYWVSYSLYFPPLPQTKSKSMKKHWSWTTTSTSHKQMAITYNSFGTLQSNEDFWVPLAWVNTMIPRF